MDTTKYLAPGTFIDSDAPAVIAFARQATARAADTRAAVLHLYAAVRDGIIYDPYVNFADPANYRASSVLASGRGFCVGKAALFAACLRTIGVPARVGYADVRNHLTSRRLYEQMKTDIFIWHSYAEVFLNDRWVKATPAFDQALCERVGLHPLTFDGETNSLFHPFDRSGQRHMEYLRDRGTFADVPFATILADFKATYPFLADGNAIGGEFRSEVVADVMGEPGTDTRSN